MIVLYPKRSIPNLKEIGAVVSEEKRLEKLLTTPTTITTTTTKTTQGHAISLRPLASKLKIDYQKI